MPCIIGSDAGYTENEIERECVGKREGGVVRGRQTDRTECDRDKDSEKGTDEDRYRKKCVL